METKIPARMVRMSEKAARVHSDLIRPATQLLYLASGSECRGGCEYITCLSPARRRQLLLWLIGGGFVSFPLPFCSPRHHTSSGPSRGGGGPLALPNGAV